MQPEGEPEGEPDYAGGGEPCVGHIAKGTPCTKDVGAHGLCKDCAPKFNAETLAGVCVLRDFLRLIAIASGCREVDYHKEPPPPPAELTWLGNYQK